MKHKFKVGDVVVGNAQANTYYGITRSGWIGVVTQLGQKSTSVFGEINVRKGNETDDYDFVAEDLERPHHLFELNTKYFDLLKNVSKDMALTYANF